MAISYLDLIKKANHLSINGAEVESLYHILENGNRRELIYQKNKTIKFWYMNDNGVVQAPHEFLSNELSMYDGCLQVVNSTQFAESEVPGKYKINEPFATVLGGNSNKNYGNKIVGIEDTTGTLTCIGQQCFRKDNNLTSIILPKCLSVGLQAALDCSSVINVNFEQVSAIGPQGMEGMGKLSSVVFNNSVLKSVPNNMPGNEWVRDQVVVNKSITTGDEEIVWAIVPQAIKISSDNVVGFRSAIFNTPKKLTDVYWKNMSCFYDVNSSSKNKRTQSYTSFSNGSTSISNIVIDNDTLLTINDADGFRRVLIPRVNDIYNDTYMLYSMMASTKRLKNNQITSISVPIHNATLYEMEINNSNLRTIYDKNGIGKLITNSLSTELKFAATGVNSGTKLFGDIINNLTSLTSFGSYSLAYYSNDNDNVLSNDYIQKVGNHILYGGGTTNLSIYLKGLTTLTQGILGNTTAAYFEFSNLTSIPNEAFRGFKGKFSISEDNLIQKIGNWSFAGYDFNAVTFKLPVHFNEVTSIGTGSFAYMTEIQSLCLPKCTSWGSQAFLKNTSLRNLSALAMTVDDMYDLTSTIEIYSNECYITCKDGYIQNGEKHYYNRYNVYASENYVDEGYGIITYRLDADPERMVGTDFNPGDTIGTNLSSFQVYNSNPTGPDDYVYYRFADETAAKIAILQNENPSVTIPLSNDLYITEVHWDG